MPNLLYTSLKLHMRNLSVPSPLSPTMVSYQTFIGEWSSGAIPKEVRG